MDALMFGDGHVILEPSTVTDWKSYCVTRGREAERLADALNEQLSLKGDR